MHEKAGEAEWILVKHDSSSVSDHFGDDAPKDGASEEPCLPFEPHQNVDDERDDIEDHQGHIGRERWDVLVDAVLGVTIVGSGFQCTIRVASVGDEAAELGVRSWHVHFERFLIVCSNQKGELMNEE